MIDKECVACGKRDHKATDHHCDPEFERKRARVERREEEFEEEYGEDPDFAERLEAGFDGEEGE